MGQKMGSEDQKFIVKRPYSRFGYQNTGEKGWMFGLFVFFVVREASNSIDVDQKNDIFIDFLCNSIQKIDFIAIHRGQKNRYYECIARSTNQRKYVRM
jgi:hypothetical protein